MKLTRKSWGLLVAFVLLLLIQLFGPRGGHFLEELPKIPRWTLILEKNKRMHIVAINAVEEIIKREIKFIIEIGLWKAGLRPEMKKGFSLI